MSLGRVKLFVEFPFTITLLFSLEGGEDNVVLISNEEYAVSTVVINPYTKC